MGNNLKGTLGSAKINIVENVIPDWNQNDPNAKDYIKNRPFYGAIEGIGHAIGYAGRGTYSKDHVRISDITDEFKHYTTAITKFTIWISNSEGETKYTAATTYYKTTIQVRIDATNLTYPQAVIIPEDNMMVGGVWFAKSGIYFEIISEKNTAGKNMWVSGLSQGVDASEKTFSWDGDMNFGVVQIQKPYIPDVYNPGIIRVSGSTYWTLMTLNEIVQKLELGIPILLLNSRISVSGKTGESTSTITFTTLLNPMIVYLDGNISKVTLYLPDLTTQIEIASDGSITEVTQE